MSKRPLPKRSEEYGFSFRFRFVEQLSEARLDRVIDAFIDMIESHSLGFGDGGDSWEWHGAMSPLGEPASATEVARATVRAWLDARPEIGEVELGPLEDLWDEPHFQ